MTAPPPIELTKTECRVPDDGEQTPLVTGLYRSVTGMGVPFPPAKPPATLASTRRPLPGKPRPVVPLERQIACNPSWVLKRIDAEKKEK